MTRHFLLRLTFSGSPVVDAADDPMSVDAAEDPMVIDTPQDPVIVDTLSDPMVVDTGSYAAPEHNIRALAMELKRRSRRLILAVGLVFMAPPTADSPTPELPTMDSNDLRLRKLSLTPNESVNAPVSEYEEWLLTAKKEILLGACDDVRSDHLLANLEKEFHNLQGHKVDEWRRVRESLRVRQRLEAFSGSLVRPPACTSVETGTCSGSGPRVGAHTP